MSERQTTIALVKPVAEYLQETSEKISLARRVDTLDGKVLGLFPNWRPSAARLLNSLREILSHRFELRGIFWEEPSGGGPPLMEAHLDEVAQQCDAIITGIGD